jgi:hypothetical protein
VALPENQVKPPRFCYIFVDSFIVHLKILNMKKFLIERTIPGVGNMTAEELEAISKTSVAVIGVLGKPYRWVESFVIQDKIYCIHEAENEEAIREHANCGSFPVDRIDEVKAVIGPDTARSLR